MSSNPHTRRRIAFALGGVFLLLGVAFAAAMWTGRDAAPPEAVQSTSADLLALSAPLPLDASGIAVAAPEPAFDGALNLSSQSALTGSGFAVADAGQYTVASHEAAIRGAAGGAFAWHAVPAEAAIQNVSVRTDTQADAALVEAESALAQFAALWASQDVQALFDTVDATGAEHGVAVPGLVRSPLGATQAAEPDDEAATEAQTHADGMLSVVDRGYGELEGGLDRIHEAQSALPAQLQAAKQATDAFGAQAQSSLDAQHEARLDAMAAQALAFEAAVQAAAQAHAEATVEAREAALAGVDEELAAQQMVLDDAVIAAHAEVDARLQAVQDESAIRLAQLDAIDAAADAAAVAHVRGSIEAQQAMAVQEAADAHAAIDAQAAAARSTLDEQAAAAHANVTAAAEAALAWGDQREAALLSTVRTAVDEAIAMEGRLHADASAHVAAFVAQHKGLLQGQALATIEQARQEAGIVLDLVGAVQQEAVAEVDHDLQVILAVAEDHRAVPTPEREAAADAWMEVHGLLAAGLEDEMDDGVDVLVKAQAVIEAAAAAEVAIA